MSQESKFDQFVYGKFVIENDSGYCLVSYSKNFKNNTSELEDIHEKKYYFWENKSISHNHKAVGICMNNTSILPEKKIILIQAAPALNKDKGFFSISGSRSFFQHRYIFVSEAEIAGFQNQICMLLGGLGNMRIPTFSKINQCDDSQQKSWLLGAEDFESLRAKETPTKIVKERIEKVWKKLNNYEQNILLQGLNVILNGKRLLLTGKPKTVSALLLLDIILLFLPTYLRSRISLAIGSVDPKYCEWAQIILKTDSFSGYSLPENMVLLDFTQDEFEKEEYLDHEYVKDFIAPTKDKYEKLITICEYLDKTTKDDSDNLVWEFQEVDGWLKLNNPSIDFIVNYPVESQEKIELLGKYLPRMEEKVQSFLDKFGKISSIPDSEILKLLELWKALPIPENNGSLMKTLLCKISSCLPDKFLEIVEIDNKFFASLEILIENQFIDYLVDKNLGDDIVQALQNACLKLIQNISQEEIKYFQKKSENIDTVPIDSLEIRQSSTQKYLKLEKLIIRCEKIFRSNKDKFQLWDLALVEEITRDDFKHLLIKQLFPIFYLLERETFDQSNLKQYWHKNFPDTLDSLTLYLSQKEKNIFHVPEIANDLRLSNDEASKLYLICLKSHSPSYEQSLPLLESAIEKSISFPEEKVKFKVYDFVRVYEWFNSQYFQDISPDKLTDESPDKFYEQFNSQDFQDKFPDKLTDEYSDPLESFLTSRYVPDSSWQNSPDKSPYKPNNSPDKVELLSILSKLVIDNNSNRWINWQELSNVLYNDDIKRTIFLDKTIGKGFPVEMLEAWLQLLDNYPESKEVETEFMVSQAWDLLTRKTLSKMQKNLTGTYQKYVGKFIEWANEKEKLDLNTRVPLDLISGELIEYITEIWRREKSINEQLWNLLNSERVLPKLTNKDYLKLIDIHWRLSANLQFLSLISLYEKANFFVMEEKELLMQYAQEIVSGFKNRQNLIIFIKKCRFFYNSLEIAEIMNYADKNLKSEISYDEVMG